MGPMVLPSIISRLSIEAPRYGNSLFSFPDLRTGIHFTSAREKVLSWLLKKISGPGYIPISMPPQGSIFCQVGLD